MPAEPHAATGTSAPHLSAARPSRVRGGDNALRRYGPLAERAFAGLREGDPLADEAARAATQEWLDVAARAEAPPSMPAPLRRLVESMASPPRWVDPSRCDRAGRLLFRSGIAGGIVLGAGSLLGGYTSPAGNKPLAFSGRLEESIQYRLAETGRFVVETCRPGGLRPGAPGWGITLRVRLMHARVRQMLLQDPRWRVAEWGVPINQHDMVGTSLLFSTVFVDGVRQFGVPVSEAEDEDYAHLWRTSGWLMGVAEDLQPKSRAESDRLRALIQDTQHPPDDDSRALTRALLESPRLSQPGPAAEGHVALGQGFARALLGEEMADGLGIPDHAWKYVVPAVGAAVRGLRAVAPSSALPDFEALGARYWKRNLEVGFDGRAATFALPTRLRRRPRAAG